jgi:hypothetical protein
MVCIDKEAKNIIQFIEAIMKQAHRSKLNCCLCLSDLVSPTDFECENTFFFWKYIMLSCIAFELLSFGIIKRVENGLETICLSIETVVTQHKAR